MSTGRPVPKGEVSTSRPVPAGEVSTGRPVLTSPLKGAPVRYVTALLPLPLKTNTS